MARMIGFENESPTIVLCVQRWRSIARSNSSASRLRLVSVTTWPPPRWCMSSAEPEPGAVHQRRPGDAHRQCARPRRAWRRPVRSRPPSPARAARPQSNPSREKKVGDVADRIHHALRHARGAAGVEHVQVVLVAVITTVPERERRPARRNQRRGPPRRSRRAGVVDLDQQLQLRQPRRRPDRRGRRARHGRTAPRRRSCRAGTTAPRRGSGS